VLSGDAIWAKEIDGQVFERGTIAQVIEKRLAGVIDEDIERFYFLDGFLNLRRTSHVQGAGT